MNDQAWTRILNRMRHKHDPYDYKHLQPDEEDYPPRLRRTEFEPIDAEYVTALVVYLVVVLGTLFLVYSGFQLWTW